MLGYCEPFYGTSKGKYQYEEVKNAKLVLDTNM